MRIAVYLNDKGFNNIDLSSCGLGNPGVGGTQLEFVLLADYLGRISTNTVLILHHNENKVPTNCEEKIVNSIEEMLSVAHLYDFLIVQSSISGIIQQVDKNMINTVLWSHNYMRPRSLREAHKSKYIKAIVAVGKEEYHAMRIFTNKVKLIYNMIPPVRQERLLNNEHIVTYIGSLISEKGFHILAKIWPQIIKRIPDAKLYVVGGGTCILERRVSDQRKLQINSMKNSFSDI